MYGVGKSIYDHVFKPRYIRYIDGQFLKLRSFKDTVLFNFNDVLPDGRMKVRTVLEASVASLCHGNSVLEENLREAAKKTTDSNALIQLPGTEGREIHIACVNRVSAHFAMGYAAEQLGLPVAKKRFVLALTRECDPRWRGQEKIRALLIRREVLKLVDKIPPSTKRHANDDVRLATLKQISDANRDIKNYENGLLSQVEIVVPIGSPAAAVATGGGGSGDVDYLSRLRSGGGGGWNGKDEKDDGDE